MLRDTDIDWGATGESTDAEAIEVRAHDDAPNRVVLGVLLDGVEAFVRRYVVLNDEQGVAVTLWIAHTHAIAAADCTPYLQINSATKRAGKTRALEVAEQLVARPWLTGRTTAAALMRKIDADSPTLLLDESDATFQGPQEYAEALRGSLNSGYRRTGKATVCIGQGAAVRAHDFSTFCPKAIAGIGKLPDTIADRSIRITLRRRTKLEPVNRWRERDGQREAAPLRKALAEWAGGAVPALRDARPELPQTLGDRAMDVLEPLLAIAEAAGGTWPTRARHAAVALMGESDDDSIGVQLLEDIREIFTDDAVGPGDALPSSEILKQLSDRETRPWATWSKGKPITGHALARLLKPFGVVAGGPMRIGGELLRGYRRAAFEDAWERYLPAPNEPQPERIPEPESVEAGTEDGDTWKL
jgi:hypothetical protein